MEKFLHGFQLIPGMNYNILKKLLHIFDNWNNAWKNKSPKHHVQAGISPKFTEKLLFYKQKIDLEKEYEKLKGNSIEIITSSNKEEYPVLLEHIPNPPFLLYRKGAPLQKHRNCIAIVGTRMPSTYGENMAFKLSENIACQGGVMVSGLAFGIDTQAHLGAVKSKKPTIAIVASGLLQITPPSQTHLVRQILEYGGTLLSEYALTDPAYKSRYHERNRLISGLSSATIIIEARIRSGALITARHALEQNRSIYALPGDITRPQAQGCLRLLKDGAEPIISIEDVLQDLGFQSGKEQQQLTLHEKIILGKIEQSSCATEELLRDTGLSMSELNTLMTSLELKGIVHKNQMMLWEKS